MTGKIDQVSEMIGRQTAELAALNRLFDQHCKDDDRRHEENVAKLDAIDQRMDAVNATLAQLNSNVTRISPIVDGYQISRWKKAGAVGLASATIAVLGWAVSVLAAVVTGWFAHK